MKLTELHTTDAIYEAMSEAQMDEQIARCLNSYVSDNNRTPIFQQMYYQAMKRYPEHVFRGKMYRVISAGSDHTPASKSRAEASKLYQAVLTNSKRRVMQLIKDHPSHVYSWSKSAEYTDKGSWNNIMGNVVLEQTGEALDIISLLTMLVPKVWPGEEFYNEFPSQQEVLAPLLHTVKIRSMTDLLPADPNYKWEGD